MIIGLERHNENKVDSEIFRAQRQSIQDTPTFMIAERQDSYNDVTTSVRTASGIFRVHKG